MLPCHRTSWNCNGTVLLYLAWRGGARPVAWHVASNVISLQWNCNVPREEKWREDPPPPPDDDDDDDDDGDALDASMTAGLHKENSPFAAEIAAGRERQRAAMHCTWPTPLRRAIDEADGDTSAAVAPDGAAWRFDNVAATSAALAASREVLVRVVTWNLQAKPAPPKEELRKRLLPHERCDALARAAPPRCSNARRRLRLAARAAVVVETDATATPRGRLAGNVSSCRRE